jgi:hypothetical protein
MRRENVQSPSSPETPPLAPYDPPEPAPQAAAWHRALKVVGGVRSDRRYRIAKATARRVTWG